MDHKQIPENPYGEEAQQVPNLVRSQNLELTLNPFRPQEISPLTCARWALKTLDSPNLEENFGADHSESSLDQVRDDFWYLKRSNRSQGIENDEAPTNFHEQRH